jgi:hypothetical protein
LRCCSQLVWDKQNAPYASGILLKSLSGIKRANLLRDLKFKGVTGDFKNNQKTNAACGIPFTVAERRF